MKGYGQICPLSRAAEVLGERWTILILRAFLFEEQSFNTLRKSMTHISPTLLSDRLKALEEVGVLERVEDKDKVYYRLTEAGAALKPILMALGHWGAQFIDSHTDDTELDFPQILWELPKRVDVSVFPEVPIVYRFEVRDASIPEFFLATCRNYAKLLVKLPKKMDTTSTVRCDQATLARLWVGERTFDEAEHCGDLEFEGERRDWQLLKKGLQLNLFARNGRGTR